MLKPTTKLVPTEEVGGGGNSFMHARPDAVIQKLRFWWNDAVLRGIELTLLTDQREKIKRSVGKQEGPHNAVLELGHDERITDLRIYSTGDRCGGVQIKTATKDFTAGPLTGTASQLGPGLAAGIAGGHGDDIDRLGFVYAVGVASYRLENVRYDLSGLDDPGERRDLSPKVVARTTFVNPANEARGFKFAQEATFATTHSWSSTFGLKIGTKISGELGVPAIGKGAWEVSAEISFSHTWGESATETQKFSFETNGTVPKGTKVVCEGIVLEGHIDVPYTGTAILTYDDGEVLREADSGVYKGVRAFDSQVVIGMPKELSETEAQQAKKKKKKRAMPPARTKEGVEERVVVLE